MERTISINLRIIESSKAIALLLFLLFTISDVNIYAQSSEMKIFPTLGVTRRSSPLSTQNLREALPQLGGYYYDGDMKGYSLNPGVQLETGKWAIEYEPILRLGHLSSAYVFTEKRRYEVIVDHNINFLLKSNHFTYGIGMSFMNVGKDFYNGSDYFDIEFKTYNLLVNLPLWKKFKASIKFLYVPYNFPSDENEKYLMYSFKIFYKFDFVNKIMDRRRNKKESE